MTKISSRLCLSISFVISFVSGWTFTRYTYYRTRYSQPSSYYNNRESQNILRKGKLGRAFGITNPNLTDRRFQVPEKSTFFVENSVQCLRRCNIELGCASIAYNIISKMCAFFENYLTDAETTSVGEIGWMYFYAIQVKYFYFKNSYIFSMNWYSILIKVIIFCVN